MKKNYIKQLFALLLVTLFAGQVNADEVLFDFNSLSVATSETVDNQATHDGDITQPYVWTIDGVTLTISVADESATNPNRFWKTNNGPQLRCYSGTITINAESNFSKIVFNAGNFDMTANKGNLASKTWTHEGTNEVVFTG